jgi:hypothetical protein
MLKEILDVRQHPEEPFRRYFWDEYLELWVWLDEQRQVIGFELSYDLRGEGRAFRWLHDGGMRHYLVDDGEARGMKKSIPVLRSGGAPVDRRIDEEFAGRCEKIDAEIARVVQARLQEYLALG